MGERALAACPVTDRTTATFDWYAAQWAASEEALRGVFGHSPGTLSRYDWQYQSRRKWSTMIDTLDYLQFEAVYRITPSGVQVYLPLWLGFGPDDRTAPSTGTLLETHSVTEFRQLRAQSQRLKATLGRGIETGTISLETARYVLLSAVSSRPRHRSK
ncbi:MAG: hypothetical protein ACOCY1_00805 [Halovenus sp.]